MEDKTKFYAHPQSLVESTKIGAGTRIWAFAHILPDAVIGSDCNICDHTFIENKVVLGDRVTIKCGVQLWDGVSLEDDVFVGPNATFTNDPFPRSRQHLPEYPRTMVRRGASIGANATILPGITIGQYSMVGAGSVVTRDVPAFAVVMGNPARISGYVESGSPERRVLERRETVPGSKASSVSGVRLIRVPVVEDLRGNLSAWEVERGLPFVPKRCFLVYEVPSADVRGEHSHKQLEQLLICVRGSLSVVVDDGAVREEYQLDHPSLGLYLPPMVWGIQYKYSSDAVLMVLASEAYNPDDYIRDYDEFLLVRRSNSKTKKA